MESHTREPLAEELVALCGSARERLILAAPFAKAPIVHLLLAATSAFVRVDVVVRWLPSDISSGVSDIEVWDVTQSRPHSTLFVRNDLHAKYYRADQCCLVGSANLTGAALGLSLAPNLELLVPLERGHPGIETFEDTLFAGSVKVDQYLVELTRAAVERMPMSVAVEGRESLRGRQVFDGLWSASAEDWVPTVRQPEDLYLAYGGESDRLSRAAEQSAMRDLAVLRVPVGLDEAAFRAYVGAVLLRMPVVVDVDRFVARPRRFGEVRDLLQRRLQTIEPPDRQWQVLLRWITYFLPDRFEYRRPGYSEIIARRLTQ